MFELKTKRIFHAAHTGLKLAQSRFSGRRVLLSVTYLVTYRCNLSCSYCPLERHGDELSTPDAVDVIDQLSHLGVMRLGLTGGEPLLRDDLATLISTAKRRGMWVNVVTNGTLLRDRHQYVKNVDALFVSLDGKGPANDQRGQEIYPEVIGGIESAVEMGLPTTLICVVGRNNVDSIAQMLQLAQEMHCRVAFQALIGATAQAETNTLTAAEQRQLFADLEQRKLAGAPIANSLAHLRDARRNPRLPVGGRCPGGQIMATVLPDGALTPCCEFYYRTDNDNGTGVRRNIRDQLDTMVLPRCTSCATIGNVEMRRLYNRDPRFLVDVFRQARDHILSW